MIRRLLLAPRVSWSGDTISTASSIQEEVTTNKSNQFQAQLLPSAANKTSSVSSRYRCHMATSLGQATIESDRRDLTAT